MQRHPAVTATVGVAVPDLVVPTALIVIGKVTTASANGANVLLGMVEHQSWLLIVIV